MRRRPLRRNAGFLRKAHQRRLMRDDELQHAGQEARLPRRLADRLRLDAGDRQETRQELRIGGDEAERV